MKYITGGLEKVRNFIFFILDRIIGVIEDNIVLVFLVIIFAFLGCAIYSTNPQDGELPVVQKLCFSYVIDRESSDDVPVYHGEWKCMPGGRFKADPSQQKIKSGDLQGLVILKWGVDRMEMISTIPLKNAKYPATSVEADKKVENYESLLAKYKESQNK